MAEALTKIFWLRFVKESGALSFILTHSVCFKVEASAGLYYISHCHNTDKVVYYLLAACFVFMYIIKNSVKDT